MYCATEINHVSPKVFGSCFWLWGRIVRVCIIHDQTKWMHCIECVVLLRTSRVLSIPVQSRYDHCDSLSWVLGRVVAFQPSHASNSPLFPQSIQLFVENLQSHHLNSCFRWRNFQRSFGTTRDMLIPMPCIGRVFHVFCGSQFSYFATPSPRNMMELSIVKRVFFGAE
jgi:hypothetical protein